MPQYTRATLKARINARIHAKNGLLVDSSETANDAVREAWSLPLRSAKRKALLAPNLFSDIYDYGAPTDLDGNMIVDFEPQTDRNPNDPPYELTTAEEFDRRKTIANNIIAVTDRDLTKKVRVSTRVDDKSLTIAQLDSLSEGTGSGWVAFGDATGVAVDTYDFVKGSASIKYNISAAGGTTAGLVNESLNTFDLTEYKTSGSVFIWQKIYSATNITNFKLRLGNSSGNYYELTTTTQNDGTAFVAGWNLLRFDFSGKTTTGTVTDTTCTYCAIYMTKTAGKVSENDYGVDFVVAKLGKISNLIYYSKYPWQNVAGTRIIESTADTDYIVCDPDEYKLIVEKGVEIAGLEAKEYDDAKIAENRFENMSEKYLQRYPNEAKQLTNTYYNF